MNNHGRLYSFISRKFNSQISVKEFLYFPPYNSSHNFTCYMLKYIIFPQNLKLLKEKKRIINTDSSRITKGVKNNAYPRFKRALPRFYSLSRSKPIVRLVRDLLFEISSRRFPINTASTRDKPSVHRS